MKDRILTFIGISVLISYAAVSALGRSASSIHVKLAPGTEGPAKDESNKKRAPDRQIAHQIENSDV